MGSSTEAAAKASISGNWMVGAPGAGFPQPDQIFAVSAGGHSTMSPQELGGELLLLADLLFSEAVLDMKKSTELRYLAFRKV